MNHLKNILLFGLLIIIAGCSSNLRIDGNFILPNDLNQLKKGLSKEEVTKLLGVTTIKASFDENTWYYIYEVSKRKLRFLNKTIIDSKVIIINFDNNKIRNIEILDYNKRRDIYIDKSQTKDILIKTNIRDNKFKEINIFSEN